MRFLSLIAACSVLTISAPALAQAITVGMPVTEASGARVGTVTAVKGDNIAVKTDKYETLIPKGSFAVQGGKLYFGMSQAQLNAEIEKSQSAAAASVVAGATAKGLSGTEIGKIESVAGDAVVIALSSGRKVQLGRSGVRGNADGTVTVGLTAEQLDAQLQDGGGSDPAGSK